ncbi:SWPV1-048 [Shearwaterpox virus]|uniref:SWPV1-048 n=1 Tax=Shearwaterpox virus TaxID=1974596 RepID=A0A1V0S7Q7_CNPV|nr:SWPV1-048 [Shearwaterpox virus]
MNNQIDIALKIYNANKFNRSICFSPKSVYSVLYMFLSSKNKKHLRVLESTLSEICNSYSCLSDTNLATGRTSCITNYIVSKDENTRFKDLDVVYIPNTCKVDAVLEYMDIDRDKEDNLCFSINNKTDLINECFMIQPLPYNRLNNCVINYYWYRIVEDYGLTILNFYPSYQTVRMIMIMCNNNNGYQLGDIDKDKLLDWTSYDSMRRSTLPFRLPKVRVESFLNITESFPEIFDDTESDYGVRANSLFEITSEKIFFATVTHSYIDNYDSPPRISGVDNNPFIVIIEDTSTKHWLFFGLIR